MRPLVCAALFPVLWAVPQPASQPALDQRPTISVETNLVMLPVTVIDRHGQFVAGLTQEQFAVYDGGERQPIQFFTNEDVPATVGIVIDCSGSMRGRRDEVTAAATAFAASAHPLDQLFSINFNERVWPGLPSSVTFAESVDQLHQALARAPATGMTALYDAIDLALDRLQLGTRDRKALIVVSDGGDNASTRTLASVVERTQHSTAVIYAVVVADPDDHETRPDVLRKFARETGGTAISPKDVGDVMTAFARIGRDIRSGYMLGVSPATVTEAGFRPIRVDVDRGDGSRLTVRTRPGYYAAPGHDTR